MHPENKTAFNKLYIKLADANPHLDHEELYEYTNMIYRSSLMADLALFQLQYMSQKGDKE